MSRNTKCTPTLTEAIAQKVRLMGAIGTAGVLCGIDEDTARSWYRKGKRRQKGYIAFYRAMKKALVEWEQSRIVNITKAEQEGTWQASAWKLERNPHTRERYRPPAVKQKTELTGKDGDPIQMEQVLNITIVDNRDEQPKPEITVE